MTDEETLQFFASTIQELQPQFSIDTLNQLQFMLSSHPLLLLQYLTYQCLAVKADYERLKKDYINLKELLGSVPAGQG